MKSCFLGQHPELHTFDLPFVGRNTGRISLLYNCNWGIMTTISTCNEHKMMSHVTFCFVSLWL